MSGRGVCGVPVSANSGFGFKVTRVRSDPAGIFRKLLPGAGHIILQGKRYQNHKPDEAGDREDFHQRIPVAHVHEKPEHQAAFQDRYGHRDRDVKSTEVDKSR